MAKSRSELQKELAKLAHQAKAWEDALFKQESRRRGAGRTHPGGSRKHRQYAPGYQDRVRLGGDLQDMMEEQGLLQVRDGKAPTRAELRKVIERMGGNPYKKRAAAMQKQLTDLRKQAGASPEAANARRQVTRQTNQQEDMLQALIEDAQEQIDAANEANEMRYMQILAERGGLRDRVMANLDGFGDTQRAEINSRFDRQIGNNYAARASQGFLANRGSARGDSVARAFEARENKNRALVLNDLEDRINSRRADYDTRLTDQLAGFMERRNDVGPDMGALATLAERYGLGNGGQGFTAPEVPAEPASATEAPVVSGGPEENWPPVSAPRVGPIVGGVIGSPAVPQFGFGFGRSPGVVSNRYPQRRRNTSGFSLPDKVIERIDKAEGRALPAAIHNQEFYA